MSDGCAFDRAVGDGVAVVLARDLDGPGRDSLHRVIPAMVPETQLVRLASERARHQLVAEADPEKGQLAEEPADLLHEVVQGSGVARPVGEEHAVRPAAEDLLGRGRRRHHLYVGYLREPVENCRLDAEVVRNDAEPPAARRAAERVGALRADLRNEVYAPCPRLGAAPQPKARSPTRFQGRTASLPPHVCDG